MAEGVESHVKKKTSRAGARLRALRGSGQRTSCPRGLPMRAPGGVLPRSELIRAAAASTDVAIHRVAGGARIGQIARPFGDGVLVFGLGEPVSTLCHGGHLLGEADPVRLSHRCW